MFVFITVRMSNVHFTSSKRHLFEKKHITSIMPEWCSVSKSPHSLKFVKILTAVVGKRVSLSWWLLGIWHSSHTLKIHQKYADREQLQCPLQNAIYVFISFFLFLCSHKHTHTHPHNCHYILEKGACIQYVCVVIIAQNYTVLSTFNNKVRKLDNNRLDTPYTCIRLCTYKYRFNTGNKLLLHESTVKMVMTIRLTRYTSKIFSNNLTFLYFFPLRETLYSNWITFDCSVHTEIFGKKNCNFW